ncbi:MULTISPECIES: helix-turn-helix domain-containing protein [unclassified Streptomyces]|uniref:helix-turn-helix domain-containing protein n=1 Tax=unclassified Streptomyces TaxID=2593676 RepID=UPI002E2E314F|nr:helix-turn-helix transcriptional regulator [Streptomyces sp. NBC_01429]
MTDQHHDFADDTNSPRAKFGEALKDARELRQDGKLSQTALAKLARTSKSTISRIENAVPPIPSHLPVIFDQIFKTDGIFKRLYDETRVNDFPSRYRRRMKLEARAIAIAEWSPNLVPGLLQTTAYARALFRAGNPRATDHEITTRADARIARQEVLHRGSPPDLSIVICEAVIRRSVGGSEVMRGQLASLLAQGTRYTTIVQVLPFSTGSHLLMDGSMSILTAPDGTRVIYTESLNAAVINDDPATVRAMSRAYDVLTATALPPTASAQVIRGQMEAL